jgi:hypothetical protein
MPDKSRLLRKNGGVSRLVPFEFTDKEMQEWYPNVKGDYHGFAVVRRMQEAVAFLAAEEFGDTLNLHIWIPKENRSKENILWLKSVLWDDVVTYAESIGCPTLVATCNAELTKTKALLDTFGFSMRSVWIGVLETKEEDNGE